MILAMLAASALLQPQDDPPPPQDVVQAADELGECLSAGINNADSGATPQAAARSIIATCQPLLIQVTDAHARWVESSNMSAAEKQESLQTSRSNAEGLEAQITQAIAASRAD